MFICSSVDGHVGCFHLLALVNNAAMNMNIHVVVQFFKTLKINTYRMIPFIFSMWVYASCTWYVCKCVEKGLRDAHKTFVSLPLEWEKNGVMKEKTL